MQQVAQKPPFNVAQELGKRFQEALGKLFFPSEKISDEWFEVAQKALRKASPLSLGCSSEDMKALYWMKKNNITMLQFAMLCNNLESKTIDDLSYHPDSYFQIQQETDTLSKLWNEQTQTLRKKIETDLVNEMATKDQLEKNNKQLAQA